MIDCKLPGQAIVFWPVGTGDSTTIVLDDRLVVQVDMHDVVSAGEDGAAVAAVVDWLVASLPKGTDGRPYLAAFILTHADKDHCLGFEDLLRRTTIGEIWATPRLWREYTETGKGLELCSDAKAFQKESERRVDATRKAVKAGGKPSSGDRIRVIGYDTDHSEHSYADLPDEYLSYPGEAVTSLDGKDVADSFEAFIHAPFRDDCAAERNDTSLAMQVTLRDDEGTEGHVLLLGDLAYATIIKIFEYSEYHGRPERLAWDVLLAPHHCSKRVMYVPEDGEDVLKQDVLDAISRHTSENGVIVASSATFPAKDKPGANPPHVKARNRYQELVSEVVCTAEHSSTDTPQPVVFALGPGGLTQAPLTDVGDESLDLGKAVAGVAAGVALGALGALLMRALNRRAVRQPAAGPGGLDTVRQAVRATRGDEAAPQQPVGFGRT